MQAEEVRKKITCNKECDFKYQWEQCSPNRSASPFLSAAMIKLTRLNNSTIYLNPDLIKSIEETPDTIISLVNDDHYLVREKTEEIIDQIVSYRVRIIHQSRQFASTDTPA